MLNELPVPTVVLPGSMPLDLFLWWWNTRPRKYDLTCLFSILIWCSGSGAYALSGNSDTVTVVSLDTRSPAQVGLYVVTQLTLSGNALTSSDRIAFGTTDCQTTVANVNDIALTSSVAVDVTAQAGTLWSLQWSTRPDGVAHCFGRLFLTTFDVFDHF